MTAVERPPIPPGFTLVPCTELQPGDRVRVLCRDGEYRIATISGAPRRPTARSTREFIIYPVLETDWGAEIIFDTRNTACREDPS